MNREGGPRRTRADARSLPGLLVEPSWLKERLGQPGVRPIDLRDAAAHAAGHIPGASHLELAELGVNDAGRDNVLLSAADFGALMVQRGVSKGDTVVVYDDQWGLAAARLLWALQHYGHDRVAVLNGGWDRWREEGGESAVVEGHVTPGDFEATPRAEVSADTGWLVPRIEAGDVVLLDTRTPAEFDRGHLPGAVSWDWFTAVPAGSWNVSRDPEELLAEWRSLGIDPSDEVIVYCRSGMRAAHTFLVLRNAGFPRVRLYDGSWQEWSMTMEGGDDI